MNSRQYRIIGITLVLVVMGFLTMKFLISQKPKPKRRPPVSVPRYVKADKVEYGNVVASVVATGRMKSTQIVDVVAEASGKIEGAAISFKKGENFKKGDVLLKIYMDEAILDLKSRKSKFLNTMAGLLPDIRVDYPNRYQSFYKFFNSINIEKDLPALPDFNNDKIKIFLASRNVLTDYYSIKKDELKLKRHIIKAPFDGSILSVSMEVGAYTNTGGKLAKIIRTDKLELEVPVESSKSEWINKGDKVSVSLKNSGKKWEGIVTRKSGFVDDATQSRAVFVEVKKSGDELLYGQYLIAEFAGKGIENSMKIPRNAVFNYDQVFVVKDGKLQLRNIKILKRNEKSVIFRGIEEGISVVVEPLINARVNTEVKILK